MYSLASRHTSDWILYIFASLCWCILLSPLILSSASASLSTSEPVWVCPFNTVGGEDLYIVPPSRVFSADYKDRQYCCPLNGFIDQRGNCGKFTCQVNDFFFGSSAITECPDIPDEFLPFVASRFPSAESRFPVYSYPSHDGFGAENYYSSSQIDLYTRHRSCCPSTSICFGFTNVSLTFSQSENQQLYNHLFTCMTMFDVDGNKVDQDYRPTVSKLNAEPAVSRQNHQYEAISAIDVSSHCNTQPCGAKGICTPTLDSYTCMCPPPFKLYPGGSDNVFDKDCIYLTNQNPRASIQSLMTAACSNSYLCETIADPYGHRIGFQAYPCPAGQFCSNGGISTNATTPINCMGAGVYCPVASSQSLVCPEGFYCPDVKTKLPCPSGSYCAAGSVNPSPCPSGSFCAQAESPFYDPQKRLVVRASPKVKCSRLNEAVTCPAGSSSPAALPAGNCNRGNSLVCGPGNFCPQLCQQPEPCSPGNYCPDGKHLVECPVGHECNLNRPSIPFKCEAGTYQPYAGSSNWNWQFDEDRIKCGWRCSKWHWNSDGASNCDSLSVWTYLFIFGLIILVPMVLFGVFYLIRHWWPLFRTLYVTASEDFNTDWNARTQVFQQELVQRIVREVMLMPISVQSSRMMTTSSGNTKSPSSPAASTSNKHAEITPELNLSLLSEYRTFLSKLLLEFLQSPDCPSIIWLLCQYKHLSVIDLQMHMSNGIKSEVMEQFHTFAAAYTHAQENLSAQQSSSQQNGEAEAGGFVPLPADVLWDATNDMRTTLKSEFFLYADSWIQLKRATNTTIQDLCFLFGGIHFPTGESRLKPPRLPLKLILQCVGLSLAQVCRGGLSVAVQTIRQRVARFTGHVGALTDSQRPPAVGDVEMSSSTTGAASSSDRINIVIPPSSSSEPQAMSTEQLPSTDQFKHALDSDAPEEDEPKNNVGTHLVDASIEASDEL